MGNVTVVSGLEESTGLMRTVTVLDGQGDDRLVLPGLTTSAPCPTRRRPARLYPFRRTPRPISLMSPTTCCR